MTLSDARDAMLLKWTPPETGLESQQSASLITQWDELRRVSDIHAWKSVSFLAGQTVEGLLRARLSALVPSPDLRRVTGLGQLISIARREKILPGCAYPATGSNSISAALILRNWSAHFDLWSAYPTEVRATQSIALTICAAEALYPSPGSPSPERLIPTMDSWNGAWEGLPPNYVVNRLKHFDERRPLPLQVSKDMQGFCDYVVRFGTLSTVIGLEELFGRRQLPSVLLTNALRNGFDALIRQAARQSEQRLVKIVGLLKRAGISDHSKVYAILLPFDFDLFLTHVRDRPPASTVFYLRACCNAEPDLFAVRVQDEKKIAEVARTFWRVIQRSRNIINAGNIVGTLPAAARATFMHHAPIDELTRWIRRGESRDSVNLGRSLRGDVVQYDPSIIAVRDAIVEAICDGISREPLGRLQQIPFRLQQMKAANDGFGQPIMQALLRRTISGSFNSDEDWSAVRRIVVDVWTFSEALAEGAVEAAAVLLNGIDVCRATWHQLCLAGVLEVVRPGELQRLGFGEVVDVAIPRPVDQWQVFLVAIATTALSQSHEVPASLRKHVIPRFPPLEESIASNLRRVVDRLATVINGSDS